MWTNVAKPTSSVYTMIAPMGKETYDLASLTYDDARTFYDGVNPNQWTGVSKPSGPSWTNVSKPV